MSRDLDKQPSLANKPITITLRDLSIGFTVVAAGLGIVAALDDLRFYASRSEHARLSIRVYDGELKALDREVEERQVALEAMKAGKATRFDIIAARQKLASTRRRIKLVEKLRAKAEELK